MSMRPVRAVVLRPAILAAALLLAPGLADAESLASIRRLPDGFLATGLSNTGLVVGDLSENGVTGSWPRHGVIYDLATGSMESLPGKGPVVSPSGRIAYVGDYNSNDPAGPGTYATLRTDAGDISLGRIPQYHPANVYYTGGHSRPYAVNDDGEVVGLSYAGGRFNRGFVYHQSIRHDAAAQDWSYGWHTDDVGSFGGANSVATGVNAHGQVVGSKDDGILLSSGWGAQAFRDGTNLGTLGGQNSAASAINDQGLVVGSSAIAPGTGSAWHAFLHDGRVMHDLGTLDGYANSTAQDINNAGLVVGRAFGNYGGYGDPSSAFLYEDGRMLDLNALASQVEPGWFVSSALAINDLGQILVDGTYQGRAARAILTLGPRPLPVPEPSSLAVLVGGLAVGVWVRRRRRAG